MPRKISKHLKKTWKKVVALKQADWGSWYSRARWKVQKPTESRSVVFNGKCKKTWWFFSCVLMNFYCYANEVLFSPPARWPFKDSYAYKTRSIFEWLLRLKKSAYAMEHNQSLSEGTDTCPWILLFFVEVPFNRWKLMVGRWSCRFTSPPTPLHSSGIWLVPPVTSAYF